MLTVVQFLETDESNAPKGGWKNKLCTRALRKIGFIDNRIVLPQAPRAREHWLVEILRENQKPNGHGCMILKPIRRVDEHERVVLLDGMYDVKKLDDIALLVPKDKTKLWVLSPSAKDSIIQSMNANAIVIDHGGDMWPRRKAAETVLEQEARRLLQDGKA